MADFEKNKKINFWWTIEFSIPANIPGAEEILSTVSALTEPLGAYIFNENDRIFLRADYEGSNDSGNDRELDEVLFEIKHYLDEPIFKDVEISRCCKTSDQPWETQHYDAFPPLNVGKNLVVMAPWHEKEKIAPGRLPLYIYPASAFGTGYHESTQIALTLLEEVVKSGDTILDVGTGTGILFIAALKLGAGRAVARDIDPEVLDETRRNVNLNGINPKTCEISEGDLLKNFNEQVNILTANILLKPNITMLPDVRGVLKPKGYAIFSGMTSIESEMFTSVLESSKLTIEKELKIGDWWGCRTVKTWG